MFLLPSSPLLVSPQALIVINIIFWNFCRLSGKISSLGVDHQRDDNHGPDNNKCYQNLPKSDNTIPQSPIIARFIGLRRLINVIGPRAQGPISVPQIWGGVKQCMHKTDNHRQLAWSRPITFGKLFKFRPVLGTVQPVRATIRAPPK